MRHEEWLVLLVNPHLYERIMAEAEAGDRSALLTFSAIHTFFSAVDHRKVPERCGTCQSPMGLPQEMAVLAVGYPPPPWRDSSVRPLAILPICERCAEEAADKLGARVGSMFAACYADNAAQIAQAMAETADDPIGPVVGHA